MKLKWNTNSKHVSIKNYCQINANHSNYKLKRNNHYIRMKKQLYIAHLSILTTILATFQLRN